MTAQLRSELLKLRTTRTTALVLAWMVALVVLVVLLHVLSFPVADLAQRDDQLRIAGLGTTVGALFASLLGALAITGEYRTGTIRPTLLATPRRARVLAAKAAVTALAGLGVGLLAAVLTAAVEVGGLHARGLDVRLTGGDIGQAVGGGALAAALFATIGVGAGAGVRSQVPALVGVCVWLLLIEPIVLGDIPEAGRFLPGAGAGAIAGATQSALAANLLAPAPGALLLIAYAGAATTLGALAITRRDVN